MVNVKPVKLGNVSRMSFSKIDEVLDMPNLIEVQKNSYRWFLEEGLKEVFRDAAPVVDYTGKLVLEFVDYRLDENPKYTVEQCKERDVTHAASAVAGALSLKRPEKSRNPKSSWAISRS